MINEEYFSVLKKLKYYEDLEKQGKLLILPFKLGTKVYRIIGTKYDGKFFDKIEINETLFSPKLINEEEIFATRNEAEYRLKEILENKIVSSKDIPNTQCCWITEDGRVLALWDKDDYKRGLYVSEIEGMKLYTLKKYELDYYGIKLPRVEVIKEN